MMLQERAMHDLNVYYFPKEVCTLVLYSSHTAAFANNSYYVNEEHMVLLFSCLKLHLILWNIHGTNLFLLSLAL